MRAHFFVLVLTALLQAAPVSSFPHFTFCEEGIDISKAKSNPSNTYEVWYLEAPVFEGAFGNLFEYLKGFHCAFGFRNTQNSEDSFIVEYDAVSEVLNATLPFIEQESNGTTELKWYDDGAICLIKQSNWTYFHYKQTKVATVTGAQFNSFLDWLPTDNSTYTKYELWNVYPDFKQGYATPIYLNSSTCVDFQWRGFDELYRLGVKFDYSKKLFGDFINIYGSKPIERSLDDPVWGPRIITFYKEWHLANIKSFEAFLKFLEELFFKHKFVHQNGRYFEIPSLHWPLLANKYGYRPLPGAPKSVIEQHLRQIE